MDSYRVCIHVEAATGSELQLSLPAPVVTFPDLIYQIGFATKSSVNIPWQTLVKMQNCISTKWNEHFNQRNQLHTKPDWSFKDLPLQPPPLHDYLCLRVAQLSRAALTDCEMIKSPFPIQRALMGPVPCRLQIALPHSLHCVHLLRSRIPLSNGLCQVRLMEFPAFMTSRSPCCQLSLGWRRYATTLRRLGCR